MGSKSAWENPRGLSGSNPEDKEAYVSCRVLQHETGLHGFEKEGAQV